MKKWRLHNKHERRFKQGHPWVYSNELQESPKGVEPGQVVELGDSGGKFLAYGIVNPASLIAFRTLSRNPSEAEWFEPVISPQFFLDRFTTAAKFRSSWFGAAQSYRLLYGEVDGCPGLVIDRYVGKSANGTAGVAYVVQPHSAGMDKNLASVREALSLLSKKLNEADTAVMISRRDAGSREREGLEKLPTTVVDLHTGTEVKNPDDYRNFLLTVSGVMGSTVELYADLVAGQKTGFFLDQLQNIKLTEGLLLRKIRHDWGPARRGLKILDLCAYVGQWSTHLTQTALEREVFPLHVTLVDASETALAFAERNVKHVAGQNAVTIERLKTDVLEPMPSLQDQGYDVVIADPPALIKSRKHIPQGQHAYLALMTTAIGKVRSGGLIVACSCSQLLSTEDFKVVLDKASRRSGRVVRWVAQGSPSVDHFSLMHFQEGHYLKCFIGQVD